LSLSEKHTHKNISKKHFLFLSAMFAPGKEPDGGKKRRSQDDPDDAPLKRQRIGDGERNEIVADMLLSAIKLDREGLRPWVGLTDEQAQEKFFGLVVSQQKMSDRIKGGLISGYDSSSATGSRSLTNAGIDVLTLLIGKIMSESSTSSGDLPVAIDPKIEKTANMFFVSIQLKQGLQKWGLLTNEQARLEFIDLVVSEPTIRENLKAALVGRHGEEDAIDSLTADGTQVLDLLLKKINAALRSRKRNTTVIQEDAGIIEAVVRHELEVFASVLLPDKPLKFDSDAKAIFLKKIEGLTESSISSRIGLAVAKPPTVQTTLTPDQRTKVDEIIEELQPVILATWVRDNLVFSKSKKKTAKEVFENAILEEEGEEKRLDVDTLGNFFDQIVEPVIGEAPITEWVPFWTPERMGRRILTLLGDDLYDATQANDYLDRLMGEIEADNLYGSVPNSVFNEALRAIGKIMDKRISALKWILERIPAEEAYDVTFSSDSDVSSGTDASSEDFSSDEDSEAFSIYTDEDEDPHEVVTLAFGEAATPDQRKAAAEVLRTGVEDAASLVVGMTVTYDEIARKNGSKTKAFENVWDQFVSVFINIPLLGDVGIIQRPIKGSRPVEDNIFRTIDDLEGDIPPEIEAAGRDDSRKRAAPGSTSGGRPPLTVATLQGVTLERFRDGLLLGAMNLGPEGVIPDLQEKLEKIFNAPEGRFSTLMRTYGVSSDIVKKVLMRRAAKDPDPKSPIDKAFRVYNIFPVSTRPPPLKKPRFSTAVTPRSKTRKRYSSSSSSSSSESESESESGSSPAPPPESESSPAPPPQNANLPVPPRRRFSRQDLDYQLSSTSDSDSGSNAFLSGEDSELVSSDDEATKAGKRTKRELAANRIRKKKRYQRARSQEMLPPKTYANALMDSIARTPKRRKELTREFSEILKLDDKRDTTRTKALLYQAANKGTTFEQALNYIKTRMDITDEYRESGEEAESDPDFRGMTVQEVAAHFTGDLQDTKIAEILSDIASEKPDYTDDEMKKLSGVDVDTYKKILLMAAADGDLIGAVKYFDGKYPSKIWSEYSRSKNDDGDEELPDDGKESDEFSDAIKDTELRSDDEGVFTLELTEDQKAVAIPIIDKAITNFPDSQDREMENFIIGSLVDGILAKFIRHVSEKDQQRYTNKGKSLLPDMYYDDMLVLVKQRIRATKTERIERMRRQRKIVHNDSEGDDLPDDTLAAALVLAQGSLAEAFRLLNLH
jgi:hypothetical protein